MNLLNISTKQDALRYVSESWDDMSLDQRKVVRHRLLSFKLSLADRELLYLQTNQVSWLDIEPPKSFYFCGLMLENLPTESPNRHIAINKALSLIPLKSKEHRTRESLLKILELLYNLEKNEIIWREIQKYARNYRDWKEVYTVTHNKEALFWLFNFMTVSHGIEILGVVIPKHRIYVYERFGQFLLNKANT